MTMLGNARHKTEAWDVGKLLKDAVHGNTRMKNLEKESILKTYERMCGVPVLQPEIRGKINQGNGLPFLSDLLYEEHLEDLKTTFMIDLDLDGVVSWTEVVSFLEAEMVVRNEVVNGYIPPLIGDYIKGPTKIIPNRHRRHIAAAAFWPSVTRERKIEEGVGKYITSSDKGDIDFYNLNMELLYHHVAPSGWPVGFKMVVKTMCVLPEINVLCLGCIARDLCFYDISHGRMDLVYHISNLDSHSVEMVYKFYEDPCRKSFIALGGIDGSVVALLFRTDDGGPFKKSFGQPFTVHSYQNIRLGRVEGLEIREFKKLHHSWVESIKYCDQIHCLMTTSNSSPVSLALLDVFERCVLITIDVPLGVTCADILPPARVSPFPITGFQEKLPDNTKKVFNWWVVTGGVDTLLRVWDLNDTKRPLFSLNGHLSPIKFLIVQYEQLFDCLLIISYGRIGRMYVWNARNFENLQLYTSGLADLPEDKPLARCYNPHYKHLLLCTKKILSIKLGKSVDKCVSAGWTEVDEITSLLYNPVYNCIITVTLGSVITRWHPLTGRKELVIPNAHTSTYTCGKKVHGITFATFNPQKNVLATAAVDGSIKMWDFYRGVAVRTINAPGPGRCLIWRDFGLLCLTSDSKLRLFTSSTRPDESYRDMKVDCNCPVSAAIFQSPSFLVLGTVAGELLFCDFATGKVIKRDSASHPGKILELCAEQGEQNKLYRNIIFDRNDFIKAGTTGKSSVECMYVLASRKIDPKIGNVIVSLDSGVLQFWSSHEKGGFITSFYCIHIVTDKVVALGSDSSNKYLFTGTAHGYLKTWLIINYAQSGEFREDINEMASLPKDIKFPFMSDDFKNCPALTVARREEHIPPLLNCFMAHGGSIGDIIYVDIADIILTSSGKWMSYWSLTGQFLNELGTILEWVFYSFAEHAEPKELRSPSDLKRIASSTTLKVLQKNYKFKEDKREEVKVKQFVERQRVLSRVTQLRPYGQPLVISELEAKLGVNAGIVDHVEKVPHLNKENLYQNLPVFKTEKITWIKPPKMVRPKRKRLELSLLHKNKNECYECKREKQKPDGITSQCNKGISLKDGIESIRQQEKAKREKEVLKEYFWKTSKKTNSKLINTPFNTELLGKSSSEIAEHFDNLVKAARDERFGFKNVFGTDISSTSKDIEKFVSEFIESRKIDNTPHNRKLIKILISLDKKRGILNEIKYLTSHNEHELLSFNCFTKKEKEDISAKVKKMRDEQDDRVSPKKVSSISSVYSVIADCLYDTKFMNMPDNELLKLFCDMSKPLKKVNNNNLPELGYQKRLKWWQKVSGLNNKTVPNEGNAQFVNDSVTQFVKSLTAEEGGITELSRNQLYDSVTSYLIKIIKTQPCLRCGKLAEGNKPDEVLSLPPINDITSTNSLVKNDTFNLMLRSCVVKAGVAVGEAKEDSGNRVRELLDIFVKRSIPYCQACQEKKDIEPNYSFEKDVQEKLVKSFGQIVSFNRPRELPHQKQLEVDYQRAELFFKRRNEFDSIKRNTTFQKEKEINVTKYEKRLEHLTEKRGLYTRHGKTDKIKLGELLDEMNATKFKLKEEMQRKYHN